MSTGLSFWTPPSRTLWQEFRRDPVTSTARWLHSCRPPSDSGGVHTCYRSGSDGIKLVCISDTHNTQPAVPDGDVLLHAGDLTNSGTFAEIQGQLTWLASLPHRYKVVIAGNHDRLLDAKFADLYPGRVTEAPGSSRSDLNWYDVIYLENSSITISFPASINKDIAAHVGPSTSPGTEDEASTGQVQLKIYGSPWTPLYGAFAFQYPPIRDVWRHAIPADADVVLTHGPPKGYLDCPGRRHAGKGCPHLTRELQRVQPRVALFGHIHSGYGREVVRWDTMIERNFAHLSAFSEEQNGGTTSRWSLVLAMGSGLAAIWFDTLLRRVLRRREASKAGKATTMVNAAVGAESSKQCEAVIVEI